MTHGDDRGLVLPPRVAQIQVVIVPVGITVKTLPEDEERLYTHCRTIAALLSPANVRVHVDDRKNYTPGWKFNHWEMHGVPVRLDVGKKEMEKNIVVASIRFQPGTKETLSLDELGTSIPALLVRIQSEMLENARKRFTGSIVRIKSFDEAKKVLEDGKLFTMPWCEKVACEIDIKKRTVFGDQDADERKPSSGAKSLCIPLEQPADCSDNMVCFACGEPAKKYTNFGRSY
jgi:prolyl-tRNA synthetase